MGNPRRNPVTDEQIIASYRETVSAYKTADALGINWKTVYSVLSKHKEPRPGTQIWRDNATKYKGKEQEIRAAYEAGASYQQLRELFGDEGGEYSLKQAIKRAGGELRDTPALNRLRDEEVEEIRQLLAEGLSQQKIAEITGRSQSSITRIIRVYGIALQEKIGSDHPGWKGGRYTDSNGYVRAWVAPDDPMKCMALNTGHVLEHRLVLARKLGRPLLRSETVHHIDGDRTNNDPANLQLRQGKHGKHVVMCCLDCGSRNIGHMGL
jgi:transposase